jgi:putative transposase
MKQKRFSDEQIVSILAQAEKGEKTIVEVCREHGVTEVSFYRWRRKFGSVGVKEVQRLRELEKENARLKRLLAERDLEIDACKELLAKNW